VHSTLREFPIQAGVDHVGATSEAHQREMRPEALRTIETPFAGPHICTADQRRSETRPHKTRPTGQLVHWTKTR
jgi:hypothetical protein